jgi:Zn-finger nucleic acid-binding protein
VQLVACGNCHSQFDVAGIAAKEFLCRCGETVENRPPAPVDADIRRCGACGALTGPETERCAYCSASIERDDRRLSLICPECFARNAAEGRFCTACGVPFRPEPIPTSGRELPCPVCGVLMPPRGIAGIDINECARCNGVWVPENDFDRLVDHALEARRNSGSAEASPTDPRVTGANPAAQAVRYRKCPHCEQFMHRRNFRKASGVIIDRCAEHGTWLDADELEQIAGYLASGREPSALLTDVPKPSRASADAAASGIRFRFDSSARRGEGGAVGSLVDAIFDFLK